LILIRADANEIIGTGHVMRCLSIARAFAMSGHDVLFVTADHMGDGLINSAGFKTVCLDSAWTEMDKEPIKEIIDMHPSSLLIVDSYHVTEDYFRRLSNNIRLAYIDDMNSGVWDVDYLINYNIYGSTLDYSSYKTKRTTLLLGPDYAPLRQEFQDVPEHAIKQVTNVLISAGGSDPENITEKIMANICPQMSNVKFHIIVGALNPWLNRIKSMAKRNTIIHINEKHMANMMQKCDIAISAAGFTLYELCACGIPTITYTLADNQMFAIKDFKKKDIMISTGDCRDNPEFINQLANDLEDLCNDYQLRKEISLRMQKLVDGNGAHRIVQTCGSVLYK
jgi:UDP-2,4-diacetamido-2,4,6-trideoxy-beta-L-altropyranose hydrolase